jgi:predicted transcriptional regulator
MRTSNKRGPLPFVPTKAQRQEVMLLVAAGMSEPSIASVIGICQSTLRKHFAEELLFGHARKQAENLARLEKAARKGNVTAMKYLAGKLEVIPERAPPEPKPQKLGKKEAAEVDAQTAHERSSWGELLN